MLGNNSTPAQGHSMSSDPIQDAIELFRNGEGEKARSLLKEIIQQDPADEAAWYWYVEMLPTLTARIRTMETFLQIAPDNQKARQALNALIKQRDDLKAAAPPTVEQQGSPVIDPESAPAAAPEVPPSQPSKPARKQATPKIRARKPLMRILLPAAILAVAALVILITNPFAPRPPSEQELYAEAMEPVLTNLEEWNEGPIMMWGIKLQSKDSWGLSTYQEDIQDPVLRVIRRDDLIANVIPLADQIASDGKVILSGLKEIIPPEEIAEQHYIVGLCVEYQVHKAEAAAAFIRHDTITQLGEDYCEDFPAAFEELKLYISGEE